MSQIEEMIESVYSDLHDERVGTGRLKHVETKEILKRFAAEVCKAMLEDCVVFNIHNESEARLSNFIKERAEKWIK